MLLDNLQKQKEQIEALALQFGARRIRVFGSVARGEEDQNSDIDFLVDLPPGYSLFKQRIPLTEQLKTLLKRQVDVVPEHELNPHMKNHILTEAIEL